MKSWGSDFGYELIGDDWKLAYQPPDPRLAEVVRQAIASARVYQEQLIAAAPRHYDRRPKTTYRASSGGGFVREGGGSDDDDRGYASANSAGAVGRNQGSGVGGQGSGIGGRGTRVRRSGHGRRHRERRRRVQSVRDDPRTPRDCGLRGAAVGRCSRRRYGGNCRRRRGGWKWPGWAGSRTVRGQPVAGRARGGGTRGRRWRVQSVGN